uniref:Small nuclear ribonucleoprotein polypeptide C n=1 Tax=Eptatretus burgeri TaxID=7764 RepID=A0A8C4QQJ0_EPTBU
MLHFASPTFDIEEFVCLFFNFITLSLPQPSVRKTHCGGRKHKENVRDFYQKWMEEQAQNLIDQTTAAFQQGKIPSTGAGAALMPPPGLGHRPPLLPSGPMGRPPMVPLLSPPPGVMPVGPGMRPPHMGAPMPLMHGPMMGPPRPVMMPGRPGLPGPIRP